MLSDLQAVCRDHLLEDKFLVVPSYQAGYEMCLSLSRREGSWINLRPTTIQGIAQGIAALDLADNGITFLNSYLVQQVVEVLVQDLEDQGMLQYFARRRRSPGLVNALSSAIFEIRGCGITAADLKERQFLSPVKGREFITLLKAFEDYLRTHSLVDGPGLLKLALNITNQKDPPSGIYIIPSFLDLSPLEARLFTVLGRGANRVIYLDPVRRSDRRSSCDCELLPRIKEANLPQPFNDGTVKMFHAYGLTNEVREVIRRIHYEEIPLDQVTVAVVSDEHLPAFYALSRELGFGITVLEGISASLTRPGRALMGLVEWVRQDYSVQVFLSWMKDSDLVLTGTSEQRLTPPEVEKLLREASVGWGRQRYQRLEALATNFTEHAASGQLHLAGIAAGGEDRIKLASAQTLYTIISEFFEVIPEPDRGLVSLQGLAQGLAYILQKVKPAKNELEQEALSELTRRLREASQIGQVQLPMEEALRRIEGLISDLRVGGSGSRPGHLHLLGYRNLIWSDRPYTFVVGLDAGFPGRAVQDPALLDSERSRISPGLRLATQGPQTNQKLMELALSTRSGRMCLSYSSFDLADTREVFPSSMLLKVHRLLRGDPFLDYSHLQAALGRPASFLPTGDRLPLNECEWWLMAALAYRQGIKGLIKDYFPGVRQGHLAATYRKQLQLGPYDGMIEVAGGELDPRQNQVVLSCSAIEHLAGCPFAYFLKYILKVGPPQDLVFDPERWLQANERGSLLHELYCRFLKYLNDRNEEVNPLVHEHLMKDMAAELIRDYAGRIPPPGQLVFEVEVREIYQACDLFLKGHQAFQGYRPLLFEAPFGLKQQAVADAGCGLADPLRIDLEGGTGFWLRGVIDRIDRGPGGGFTVWDYKTGSTYGYQDNGYLKRGRQVQHALYALAAEEILRQRGERDPRVCQAGYYFPTQRGEGKRILRDQMDRTRVQETLGHLFDLLRDGTFLAAEDGEKCIYCDYREVCGHERALLRTREALKANPEDYLVSWRRLMVIE